MGNLVHIVQQELGTFIFEEIIVVSNSPSKRIEYFVEAGRSLQTGVRFMTYEELFNCLLYSSLNRVYFRKSVSQLTHGSNLTTACRNDGRQLNNSSISQ